MNPRVESLQEFVQEPVKEPLRNSSNFSGAHVKLNRNNRNKRANYEIPQTSGFSFGSAWAL